MSTFRSLAEYNYRTWAVGFLISNVGTWMQRTAQDWIVLTDLTHQNATAVGIVSALQFGPQVLLLPVTGLTADRVDRRKLLYATQTAMGILALGLGLLTVLGLVRLWHVYVFALLLGCVTAFDSPARQTFVTDLVGERDLPNAVALNSASFNGARLIGPAVAGLLIVGVGSGWVFIINAASFVAVLVSLSLIRTSELRVQERPAGRDARLSDGFRYLQKRPDLQVILLMMFLVCTFGLNFPIFISTMAVSVFHKGAGEFGLLTSIMAVGSVAGALLAARRTNPGIPVLLFGAAMFSAGIALAAIMPSYATFSMTLVLIGISAQTFTTTSNATVQLATEPAMRGRIMAILLAIALGGTPLGAPLVGWIADRFGPRWALGAGALGGLAAVLVGVAFLARQRDAKVAIGA